MYRNVRPTWARSDLVRRLMAHPPQVMMTHEAASTRLLKGPRRTPLSWEGFGMIPKTAQPVVMNYLNYGDCHQRSYVTCVLCDVNKTGIEVTALTTKEELQASPMEGSGDSFNRQDGYEVQKEEEKGTGESNSKEQEMSEKKSNTRHTTLHPLLDLLNGSSWKGIDIDVSVTQAVQAMIDLEVSSLIVTDEQRGIVGIVTERDILKKLDPFQSIDDGILVRHIMSNELVCVDPLIATIDAMATMSKKECRHLAIINEEMKDSIKGTSIPREAMKSVLSMKDLIRFYSQEVVQGVHEKPEDAQASGKPKDENTKDVLAEAMQRAIETVAVTLKEKYDTVNWILNTRIEDKVTVAEAVQEMALKNVGAVIILDNESIIKGIFTERDYLTKIVSEKKNPSEVLVVDVCTRKVQSVGLESTIGECAAICAERSFRHLPVAANGEIMGLLTMKDIARVLTKGKKSSSWFGLMDLFRSSSEHVKSISSGTPAVPSPPAPPSDATNNPLADSASNSVSSSSSDNDKNASSRLSQQQGNVA